MDLVVTCHGRSWGGSWEAPIEGEGGLGLTAGSWRMAGDSESEQSRSKRRGWPPRVVQCRLQKGEGDFGRRWWKVEGGGPRGSWTGWGSLAVGSWRRAGV